MKWLWSLGSSDLERLEVALLSHRIRPGDGGMVLRSLGLPMDWAAGLGGLQHWSLEQLIEVIQARRREIQPRFLIEVVRTQPLHVGLDGLDTVTVLRRLFSQAEREVWIAGFRLTEQSLFSSLARESAPLRVRLLVDLDLEVDVWGRHQLRQDPVVWPGRWYRMFLEKIWPKDLSAPEVFYAPSTLFLPGDAPRSMHAKTVLVDGWRWLVTSANFTDRGQERNFELGALIEDRETGASVMRWFEEGIGAGFFVRLR